VEFRRIEVDALDKVFVPMRAVAVAIGIEMFAREGQDGGRLLQGDEKFNFVDLRQIGPRCAGFVFGTGKTIGANTLGVTKRLQKFRNLSLSFGHNE
jgi:hypothetical protein